MQIRVYYEDTDCGGVVYHTNYIKYCERARSEVFFSENFPLENKGAVFVVKSLTSDFIKSAKLGDILNINSNIKLLKKASIVMVQEIYKDSEKIFTMEILLVYVKNGKPTKIDEETLSFFNKFLIR